jgi:hypothetical protein
LAAADQLFGPITTIQKDGITKKIPWRAFELDDDDFRRVEDVLCILEVQI